MELISYTINHTQAIYDRIKHLYEVEIKFDDVEDAEIPDLKVRPVPEGVLNRAVYLWEFKLIDDLEVALNELVGFYNDQGVTDPDNNYANTGEIRLVRPGKSGKDLIIDNFEKTLDKNYDVADKLLDQLEKNVNEYM